MAKAKLDPVMRDFQRQIYGDESTPTPEEQLRRDREVAAEFALRDMLTRQFGNYALDGAEGTISSSVGFRINYRALARAAIANADLVEGRPLRGAPSQPTEADRG